MIWLPSCKKPPSQGKSLPPGKLRLCFFCLFIPKFIDIAILWSSLEQTSQQITHQLPLLFRDFNIKPHLSNLVNCLQISYFPLTTEDTSFQGTCSKYWEYCFFNPWKNSGAPRWQATINKLKKLTWGKNGNISTPSIVLWGGTLLSAETSNSINVAKQICASRRFWRHKYGNTAREMYNPAESGESSRKYS